MAAVPLFRGTKMAAVTSRENTSFSKMSAKRGFERWLGFQQSAGPKFEKLSF